MGIPSSSLSALGAEAGFSSFALFTGAFLARVDALRFAGITTGAVLASSSDPSTRYPNPTSLLVIYSVALGSMRSQATLGMIYSRLILPCSSTSSTIAPARSPNLSFITYKYLGNLLRASTALVTRR